jgi:hypothetical protein
LLTAIEELACQFRLWRDSRTAPQIAYSSRGTLFRTIGETPPGLIFFAAPQPNNIRSLRGSLTARNAIVATKKH